MALQHIKLVTKLSTKETCSLLVTETLVSVSYDGEIIRANKDSLSRGRTESKTCNSSSDFNFASSANVQGRTLDKSTPRKCKARKHFGILLSNEWNVVSAIRVSTSS